MSKKIFLLSVLLLFFANTTAFSISASYYTLKQKKAILKAKDLMFNGDYVRSRKIFEKLDKDYPESPLGPFGLMVVCKSIMVENDDFSEEKEFYKDYEEAKKRIQKIKDKNKYNPFTALVEGAIHGLKGLHEARKHKWLTAIKYGFKGLKLVQRSNKEDPSIYENYLGIGLYHYYRSYIASKLDFLPFIEDAREEGIKEIKKAMKKSTFVKEASAICLEFVYYYTEKKYDTVMKIAKAVLKKYPKNVISWSLLGKVYKKKKKWKKSQECFSKIMEITPKSFPAYYHLGEAYLLEGKELDKSIELFEKVIAAVKEENIKRKDENKYMDWKAYSLVMMGQAYIKKGDRKKGFKLINEGVALEDDLEKIRKKIIKKLEEADKKEKEKSKKEEKQPKKAEIEIIRAKLDG